MNNLAVDKYLSSIGSTQISWFHDREKINDVLTEDKIGSKYYIMFEEYTDDEEYGYTLRPATLVGIERNYNTNNKEFIFNYEDAVFPYLEEYGQPKFARRIGTGNSAYTLYSYVSNK
jgi:hypothetical protein